MDDKLSCAVIFPKELTGRLSSGNPKKIEIVSVKEKKQPYGWRTILKLYTDNIYILAQASGGKRAVFEINCMKDTKTKGSSGNSQG